MFSVLAHESVHALASYVSKSSALLFPFIHAYVNKLFENALAPKLTTLSGIIIFVSLLSLNALDSIVVTKLGIVTLASKFFSKALLYTIAYGCRKHQH